MDDALERVVIQVAGRNYERWDKSQIIVALIRTKRGVDIVFVGSKEEKIRAIIRLKQTRNERTDHVESMLDLFTMKSVLNDAIDMHLSPPSLITQTFPYRTCDVVSPQHEPVFLFSYFCEDFNIRMCWRMQMNYYKT